MDMRRVTTSFQTSQSMGTKEICILVVHDDPIYRNIVAEMLQYCSHYEVLKFEKINDALNAIREKKDRLNLILTDIHRSNTNGFEILQFIEKEFKLPIISMSPIETAEPVSIGLESGVKLYFLKSLSVNEFKTLWQYAYAKERGKEVSAEVATTAQASIENTPSSREVNRSCQKRKRRESKETDEQDEGDDSPNEKKQRVVWTDLMHQKFLEAVEQLGHERAFPKRIVEVMNVPGLTRESVASHLQKYRMCMKKAQQGMMQSSNTGSIYGMNLTTHVKETCFPSIHSALNFNSASQGNPLYRGNISMPYTSNQSCLFNPEASNLGPENLFRVRNQENLQYPYGLNESSRDAMVENSISQIGSESTSSVYVGYRLAGNGKSVESGQMGVSGNDESLVQCPSTSSMDGISEQQPCLPPPFLSIPHDLDSLGDGGVMDVLLNPLGSRSPEMFWNGDFDDTLFNHTD